MTEIIIERPTMQKVIYKLEEDMQRGVSEAKSVQSSFPASTTTSPNEVDCDSNIDPQVSNEDYCSGYCIVAISFYPLSTSSYQGKREIVSLQLADQIHKS